jgi:hypothetical protein
MFTTDLEDADVALAEADLFVDWLDEHAAEIVAARREFAGIIPAEGSYTDPRAEVPYPEATFASLADAEQAHEDAQWTMVYRGDREIWTRRAA